MAQCTATSKRTHQRCEGKAMKGRKTCYYHGGATPIGPAAPRLTHGRYSTFAPTRLLARYQAAQADPVLLSLRDDIAMLDARLSELFSRLDSGESGALWAALVKTFDAFGEARRQRNMDGMRAHLAELEMLMSRGRTDYLAWTEIAQKWEQRRRLVETEHRRDLSIQHALTAERALLMMGTIVHVITRHVSDQAVLAAIVNELQILCTQDPGASVYGVAASG